MPWRFNFPPSIDTLKELVKDATQGPWESNCASEIFATIDGEVFRIGHFQGCAADAKAVVDLMNYVRSQKTMNDLHGDGSSHLACVVCGLCVVCGDCKCFNQGQIDDGQTLA